MKKKFLWIGLVGSCVFSCQDNSTEITGALSGRSSEATIRNGHLAFDTDMAYEAFLSKEESEKMELIKALDRNASFVSFKNVRYGKLPPGSARITGSCEVPDSVIENNEDFFSILDKEGIVEIEGALYKYDYCNDGVFVISSEDAQKSEYYDSFLRGTEVPDVVGFFPAYVDAIEAVSSGYKTMPDTSTVRDNEIFARSGIFGSAGKEHFFVYNNPKSPKASNLLDGKLAYDKFAIYFHFYGKEKYQTPCFFNWCTTSSGSRDWYVKFEYWYRRKGHSHDTNGSGTVTPVGSNENKADKTFYSGKRGLRRGCAQWDVENVYAKSAYIERNGGAHWFQMGKIIHPDYTYINNYNFTHPNFVNPNHFYICF